MSREERTYVYLSLLSNKIPEVISKNIIEFSNKSRIPKELKQEFVKYVKEANEITQTLIESYTQEPYINGFLISFPLSKYRAVNLLTVCFTRIGRFATKLQVFTDPIDPKEDRIYNFGKIGTSSFCYDCDHEHVQRIDFDNWITCSCIKEQGFNIDNPWINERGENIRKKCTCLDCKKRRLKLRITD